MKAFISIFFLSFGTLVFSQSKITLPDSLINREFKPISLHLNEWSKSFSTNDEKMISDFPVAFSNNGFKFNMKKASYSGAGTNMLNPHGTSDPLQSLFIGTANYFINRK